MKVELEQRLINVAEYHRMGEVGILEESGIELIYGKILKMSPIGSKHAACVNKINQTLSQFLLTKAIISIQNPINISSHSEPEPDITVLRPDEDFYASQHPESKEVILVIEVADSSIEYDREIKALLYAEGQIPEYWIVDLTTNQVFVFQNPKNGQYRNISILTTEDVIKIPEFGIEFEVKRIL